MMTGQPSSNERCKVLIADDSMTSRSVLSLLVQRAGHIPVEAGDGQEALLLARREVPDLVLLDVSMPHMDGYQVCAEIAADPSLCDVPVVLVSGRGASSDKIRGLDLGAADYVTKPFNLDEVQARIGIQLRLRQLSQSLAHLNRELLKKQERLEEDLRAAAGIQRSLLPRGRPVFPGAEVAWRSVPSGSVGGDIVNAQALEDGRVAAYVLDVSGHGLPSAMVTVWGAQTLTPSPGQRGRSCQPTGHPLASPGELLDMLDREYPFERFERFFTISYVVLDSRTGELRFSAAGHPPPILLRSGGVLEMLDRGGPPIGMGLLRPPYEEGRVRLERGDRLFLYTDGVVERMSSQGEGFGYDRLHALLKGATGTLEEGCEALLGALQAHGGGAPQEDDISFLALEYLGAAPPGSA